jgi:hypothetical protein
MRLVEIAEASGGDLEETKDASASVFVRPVALHGTDRRLDDRSQYLTSSGVRLHSLVVPLDNVF